jgi:putative ABC transport system substrate-binding protein
MTRRIVLLALALSFASGIALLGPSVSRGAEPAQRVVRLGFVSPASPSTVVGVTQFWERLRELGYVEGQNLVIEARWAEARLDRLPALMAEVIGRKVDVLITYSTPAALAARNATSTIPIVVGAMGDPVATGLAASLARPGGNLTGLSMGYAEGTAGKWLEMLKEVVPRLSTVAVVMNTANPLEQHLESELETVAAAQHLKLQVIDGRESEALVRGFELARRKAQAVLVLADPVTNTHRKQIIALAARVRLPALYALTDSVGDGGLMAYGPDVAVMFRRAAELVDKILKGARPADLPIEQPTQYELVVNLKTARALGLIISQSILLRADEVIR